MKQLVLVSAVMAGFSSIYPVGPGHKIKFFEHAIDSLTAQMPTDQQELAAFIEAKKTFIRSCVRDMRQLMHENPNNHEIQAFARTCNNMEAILRVIDSVELT
jgi:hypothetical protein